MGGVGRRLADAGFAGLYGVLRRRALVIGLCLLAVPIAALAVSLLQPKTYTSSASLLFRQSDFEQQLFGQSFTVSQPDQYREAATNQKLLDLKLLAVRTARVLGAGVTANRIHDEVSVAPEGQSNVIKVTVDDRSPALAARIANTFAREYIAFRQAADRAKVRQAVGLVARQIASLPPDQRATSQARDLRTREKQLRTLAALQTSNAELVEPAGVPGSPSSPQPLRNTILGAFIGLILGLMAAFVLDRLDRRIRTPDELEAIFGQPLLATIPVTPHPDQPDDLTPFQMLRANLRYLNVGAPIKVVLITSARPGDGKSTLAWNLALTAAQAGERVGLVEADLRRPVLADRLGIPTEAGVGAVLSDQAALNDVIRRVPLSPPYDRVPDEGELALAVLFAGPPPPDTAGLLGTARMRDLLENAASQLDLVVVDSAPTSMVPDTIPLVNQVDGVIVVASAGQTTRDESSRLRHRLEQLSGRLLGVVLNRVQPRDDVYGYSYGYGSGVTVNGSASSNGRRSRVAEPASAPPQS